MAQSSSPDYRALVCVFLFGGNDSNNTIIPMDDGSFRLTHSDSRKSGAAGHLAYAHHENPLRRAYAFHGKLTEVASMFSTKELAVVAIVGSAGPAADPRAQYPADQTPVPLNLSHTRISQIKWQTSVAQGHSPTGSGGRAADYIAAQNINSTNFPTFFSVAGNALLRKRRPNSARIAVAG